MALSEFQENSASERVRNDQILQALSQELQDTQRKNEILILMVRNITTCSISVFIYFHLNPIVVNVPYVLCAGATLW